MFLQIAWFVLVGVLLAGYAVLDGYDLGTGALYPFLGKSEADKAAMRHSIGPYWDANEVWLLTGAGALFAAFPPVYATVFSGFYLALMLVLWALIFRAVAVEFATRDPEWARLWDWGFFLGSALPALLFGVAAGNIVRGLPLYANGDFAGSFFTLLNPYALLAGVTGLALFVAHGANWVALTTDGDLRERARDLGRVSIIGSAVVVALLAAATAILVPARFFATVSSVFGWVFGLIVIVGLAYSFHGNGRRRGRSDLQALGGTGLALAGLVGLWATAIFPALVPTLPDSVGSALTITNSSSSQLTLTVMLIIALVGVPIMLVYTAIVYRHMTVTSAGAGY